MFQLILLILDVHNFKPMKRLITLLLICGSTTLFSQPCLPEGIIFTTQTQIDSFQINYPGCTTIQGGIIITGNDINNLEGLNVITSIDAYLTISGTTRLKNLMGMELLSYPPIIFTISDNDSLNSLFGLGPITSVNKLEIYNNPVLQSLSGLDSLKYVFYTLSIESNNSLVDLTGLDNLKSISHLGTGLYITNNQNLQNLTGLGNLTFIDNTFWLENNPSLENLSGLESIEGINENFNIINNSNLADLSGLNSLTSVGWSLEIKYNEKLKSLSGLNSLTSVGALLNIQNSDSLKNILALENLNSLSGLQIYDNNIIQSLAGIEGINSNYLSYLNIKYNDSLSECDVLSLCSYLLSGGGAMINNNNTGCNSPAEVQEACLTGVAEINDNLVEFEIFPNPTNKRLNINALNSTAFYGIEIRNLYGQVVKEENNIESLYYTLNVADIKPGVYFYVIKEKGVVVQQGKIIKK